MRLRVLSLAGLGSAALVLALLPAGGATASGSPASLRASGVGTSHGTATPSQITSGKCGTGFGPELPTVDGVISWSDGGSYDTAGAADVVCTHTTRIKSVSAYGYFGQPTETFHVTFYANDPGNGTDEANDAAVLCDYPALTGKAGGQYPVHAKTTLKLKKKCKLKKGISWVRIQNADSAGPWYWEMQDAAGGSAAADWNDVNNVFGSGCTALDNDRYLLDCLGYDYPDWELQLK